MTVSFLSCWRHVQVFFLDSFGFTIHPDYQFLSSQTISFVWVVLNSVRMTNCFNAEKHESVDHCCKNSYDYYHSVQGNARIIVT